MILKYLSVVPSYGKISEEEFAISINKLMDDRLLINSFGVYNKNKIK